MLVVLWKAFSWWPLFQPSIPEEPLGSLFLSPFLISFIIFSITSWTGMCYLVDSSLVHQLDSFPFPISFPLSFLMFLSLFYPFPYPLLLSCFNILSFILFLGLYQFLIYFPLSFPFPLSSWCAVDLVGQPVYLFLHF